MGKVEKTRQKLIETAASMFNKKGISGTSVDDVLLAAEVTKGSLYHIFESKEALSYEAVDFLLNKILEKAREGFRAGITAEKKLHAFMDMYRDPLKPLIDGGCPMLNLGVESDDTNPIIRQKVNTLIKKTIISLEGIINEGIDTGEFSSEFNAHEFALKLFTIMEGTTLVCRVANSRQQMNIIINMLVTEIKSYKLL